VIHVAVGVIRGPDGRILISRRAAGAHQGGLWEFPGGKVEADETVTAALARELREELAIEPASTPTPLCQVQHDYGDKQVLLDVWTVNRFTGDPQAMEGQPLRWLRADELVAAEFPIANRPIIRCLQLRDRMLISPPEADADTLTAWLRHHRGDPTALLQIRFPGISQTQTQSHTQTQSQNEHDFTLLLQQCLADEHDRRHIVLNGDPETALALNLGGCHLNSGRLMSCNERPVPENMPLGASCHTAEELAHASAIGADYAFVSPVLPTPSHPDGPTLGWEAFTRLCAEARLPVYALGGMRNEHLQLAVECGARGVAGISLALWSQTGRADPVSCDTTR